MLPSNLSYKPAFRKVHWGALVAALADICFPLQIPVPVLHVHDIVGQCGTNSSRTRRSPFVPNKFADV